jgi:hypothetical protein
MMAVFSAFLSAMRFSLPMYCLFQVGWIIAQVGDSGKSGFPGSVEAMARRNQVSISFLPAPTCRAENLYHRFCKTKCLFFDLPSGWFDARMMPSGISKTAARVTPPHSCQKGGTPNGRRSGHGVLREGKSAETHERCEGSDAEEWQARHAGRLLILRY